MPCYVLHVLLTSQSIDPIEVKWETNRMRKKRKRHKVVEKTQGAQILRK